MRRLILICLVILSCKLISTAQNENTSVSTSIILKNRNQNRPKKPKVPSLQYIQCIYQNGCLYFQFAIPEGECQLTVTDMTTGFARQYVFDSSAEATVYVGALTQAHIEISTANGHEYEGWLAMEP